MKAKLSHEQKIEVLKHHSEGKSLRDIGKLFKVSYVTIKRVIEASGAKTHQRIVYSDPMEPVLKQIGKVELALSALTEAYKKGIITREEQINEEELLAKKYCRWIERFEVNKHFHYYDKNTPLGEKTVDYLISQDKKVVG